MRYLDAGHKRRAEPRPDLLADKVAMVPYERKYPIGAEVLSGGTHFRIWAPKCTQAHVILNDGVPSTHCLDNDLSGYHSKFVEGVSAGVRYSYRLDGEGSFPDPASRCQPGGVHEPSQVVDPKTFAWTDSNWKGVVIEGQILYEMHIGTFTPEGTWNSAMAELPRLADIGITCLELMPVAEFPGDFGWGYDGVFWFAPSRLYGTPDDFRAFVNRAHSLSLGVILDVVYNHLGPDGNYLARFSPFYFSQEATEWGEALNFDGEHCQPVREFVISNARYWIEEFHLDGLRLDATQQIFDRSDRHIIAEATEAAREAAKPKKIIVVGENEPNNTDMVLPEKCGGLGIDALWNDDFHHSARVALTGYSQAYYSGYKGSPQELISAVKYGCLYQGQIYYWQKQQRGKSRLHLPPSTAIIFLENHDQVANSARGERLRSMVNPSLLRAMTALTLLAPGTPMLFQGQEFGATTPFCYFADHHGKLSGLVHQGRMDFLSQFPDIASAAVVPDLADPATFLRSKLNPAAADESIVALHRDLLTLRRSDPAFCSQKHGGVDGAVLSAHSFVLRFLTGGNDDRLLLVNLGPDLHLRSPAEPLLASPQRRGWRKLWSSEDIQYGGSGATEIETPDGWKIPGHSAVVLSEVPG